LSQRQVDVKDDAVPTSDAISPRTMVQGARAGAESHQMTVLSNEC